MNQPDACDAVYRLLEYLATKQNPPFIRMLEPNAQAEAREYIRGLALIARRRGPVPVPSAENK